MRRPNPLQWTWYAFGGTLPARYREWVLRDLTCRTWFLRHVVRAVVLVSPALLLMFTVFGLLLGGPPGIVAMSMAMGLIVGVYYALSYAPESADARAARYGYPAGHATATRKAARSEVDAAARSRYESRWRTG